MCVTYFCFFIGLSPDEHDFIANAFHDPLVNKVFSYSYDSFWYKDIEPVSITAERERVLTAWTPFTVMFAYLLA